MPRFATTASNDRSEYGSASASPSSKRRFGCARRASASMAGEKSTPIGVTARHAAARCDKPRAAAQIEYLHAFRHTGRIEQRLDKLRARPSEVRTQPACLKARTDSGSKVASIPAFDRW